MEPLHPTTQVTFEMSVLHSIDDVLCHEHPFQLLCGHLPRASSLLGTRKHSSVCQHLDKHVNNLCDSLHVNKCCEFDCWISMPGPANVGENATSYLWAETQKKVLPRMIITQ